MFVAVTQSVAAMQAQTKNTTSCGICLKPRKADEIQALTCCPELEFCVWCLAEHQTCPECSEPIPDDLYEQILSKKTEFNPSYPLRKRPDESHEAHQRRWEDAQKLLRGISKVPKPKRSATEERHRRDKYVEQETARKKDQQKS